MNEPDDDQGQPSVEATEDWVIDHSCCSCID